MKKVVVFAACAFSLCLLVLLVYQDSSRPELTGDWVTPLERSIPEDTPIVGLWMDEGQPVVLAVVAHGTRYFEYDALHPEGPASVLYNSPPMWWTPMPGAAR
jgi:hypothetical protein